VDKKVFRTITAPEKSGLILPARGWNAATHYPHCGRKVLGIPNLAELPPGRIHPKGEQADSQSAQA
jgi:hypothetical protein